MSRRRGASLALAMGIAAAVGWMFHQAPRARTVAYDLGELAPAVTGLQVRYATPEGNLVWKAAWRFEAGEAPVRVEHAIRHPTEPLELRTAVDLGGQRLEDARPFDGAADGDAVVVYLGQPGGRRGAPASVEDAAAGP